MKDKIKYDPNRVSEFFNRQPEVINHSAAAYSFTKSLEEPEAELNPTGILFAVGGMRLKGEHRSPPITKSMRDTLWLARSEDNYFDSRRGCKALIDKLDPDEVVEVTQFAATLIKSRQDRKNSQRLDELYRDLERLIDICNQAPSKQLQEFIDQKTEEAMRLQSTENAKYQSLREEARKQGAESRSALEEADAFIREHGLSEDE